MLVNVAFAGPIAEVLHSVETLRYKQSDTETWQEGQLIGGLHMAPDIQLAITIHHIYQPGTMDTLRKANQTPKKFLIVNPYL